MAVDVLEGVKVGVGHRHQLDHAIGRVVGQACAFFEVLPAQVVLTDVLGHFADAGAQAFTRNQAAEVSHIDIAGHDELLCYWHRGTYSGAVCLLSMQRRVHLG
ncbi:hypothetical protein D3C75_1221470 [compost metagenome]